MSDVPTLLAPVVVVGEVLVDVLPDAGFSGRAGVMNLTGRFGGSPANVAIGLARLGVRAEFVARLAVGGYGPWLRAHLASEQVGLGLSVDADEPCTLAVVTLDRAGIASYEFYGPASADWAWQPGELPDPAALAGGCVHTGSLATWMAPGAGVIVEWLRAVRRRNDVMISYDPNIRPSLIGEADDPAAAVHPLLSCAHVVKTSDEDLGVLYPGATVDAVVGSWLAGGAPTDPSPDLVVVTQGAAGATAWHRDGRVVHDQALPSDVVDTVGAGDAFTAGFLSGLHDAGLLHPDRIGSIDDADLKAALVRANRVAALTCGRPGADPPRADEI